MSSQAQLSEHDIKPASVSSNIKPVFLAGYIVSWAVVLFVLIAITIGFLSQPNRLRLGWPLFILALYLQLLRLLFYFSRLPIRTLLRNDKLITYGLRGRQQVSLSALSSLDKVALLDPITNKQYLLYALRLTDAEGRAAIVHIGSLPSERHIVFLTAIINAIGQAGIHPDRSALELLKRWSQPETFWSGLKP